MNFEKLTFDDYLLLSKGDQKKVIDDVDLLKYLVKNNVSEHRYLHSLSVANVCKDLAYEHHYDPKKAYLAGLLHDCCKFPNEKTSGVLEWYLVRYNPSKLNGILGAYHSWVAPYYLQEKMHFEDNEILNAIYNHTILNSDDTLSFILYIADKREPLRGVCDDTLNIAKYDLKKAYQILKLDVEEYIKKKNERFVENSI